MTKRPSGWGLLLLYAVMRMLTGTCGHVYAGDKAGDLVRAAEHFIDGAAAGSAVERLLKASELRPDWYVPISRLAVAYQSAGMDTAALQEYIQVQAIALETLDPNAVRTAETKRLIAEAEGYMTFLTNATRMELGLRLLYPAPSLSLVARRHAAEMRDLDYFSHVSPRPANKTCLERFNNLFPYRPRVIAENLARRWQRGGGYCLTLAKIRDSHEALLNSPGHRANIVMPELTDIGIGVAVSENGDYWLTEVFVDFTGHPQY